MKSAGVRAWTCARDWRKPFSSGVDLPMADRDVRVSVLIPVFNRRELVGDAVRSALAQEIDGLEIVVVDNCSDDGTWELLQQFRDPRLRCLRNEKNVGLFGNFNRCAAQARGDYAIFLCSDDRLLPGFLSFAVPLMEAQPGATLLSSRAHVIDSDGHRTGTLADHFAPGTYAGRTVTAAWFWINYHYGVNPLNYPSGTLFRTSVLRDCLPFRAELGAPADIDMYLRVLARGNLIVTEEAGCRVMCHTGQVGQQTKVLGQMARQDSALLEAFRVDLEAAGVYRTVHRQVACRELAAIARAARTEPRKAIELLRTFNRGPVETAVAVGRRFGVATARALFGLRLAPYLRPVASD
jgi:hypothetical protein